MFWPLWHTSTSIQPAVSLETNLKTINFFPGRGRKGFDPGLTYWSQWKYAGENKHENNWVHFSPVGLQREQLLAACWPGHSHDSPVHWSTKQDSQAENSRSYSIKEHSSKHTCQEVREGFYLLELGYLPRGSTAGPTLSLTIDDV